MKLTARQAGIVAGSLGLVLGLGACSQTGTTAHSAAPANGSSSSASAPEVNPAGDIPDNQVYVPFTPTDRRFTVSVPEGWARTVSGSATLFSDKFNSVRIETVARAQPPTAASATAEELPTIQSSSLGYVPGSVSTVQRKAGQAVLIMYQAQSAPDAVTGKTVTESKERYEFWHNGQELILTLSGPKGADNVDPWRTITDSVRWA